MSALRRASNILTRNNSSVAASVSSSNTSFDNFINFKISKQHSRSNAACAVTAPNPISILTEQHDAMTNKYFTKNHEWIQIVQINPTTQTYKCRIGVTDFRSVVSGDFINISLDSIDLDNPEDLFLGEEICEIDTTTDRLESVTMPVNGKVIGINNNLMEISPLLANRAPENEGWLAEIEIKNEEDIYENLMNKEEYDRYLICSQEKYFS